MSKRGLVLLFVVAVTCVAVAQLQEGPARLGPQAQRQLDAAERAYLIKARTELLKAIPTLTSIKPLTPNAGQQRIDSIRTTLRVQIAALGDTLGTHGYWTYMPSDFSALGGQVRQFGEALGMDCGRVVSTEDETNATNYMKLVDATMTPDLSLHKDSTPSDPYGVNSPFTAQFKAVADSVKEARKTLESIPVPTDISQQTAPKALGQTSVKDYLNSISSFATVEGPRLSQPGDQPLLNARVCRISTNLQRTLETDPKAKDESLQRTLLKVQDSLLQLRQQTIRGKEQFLPCDAPGCPK